MSDEQNTERALPEMNDLEREMVEHRERFKSLFVGGFAPMPKYEYARVFPHNPYCWEELENNLFIVTGWSQFSQSFSTAIVARNEFATLVATNMRRKMGDARL